MTDMAGEHYDPLFFDQDPRTSFLALLINDRSYRMGESSVFRTRLGGTPSNPALVFESSFITVTEEFSFVKTSGSSLVNGVQITITVTNRSERPLKTGVRLLLDTTLGEGETSHFSTENRQINVEAALDGGTDEPFWVSANRRVGLMGSLYGQNLTRPDMVHFANWKRLNEVPWKTSPVGGRNFNQLPYSIGDSAVCYYYDPVSLEAGETRVISLALASGDAGNFVPGGGIPNEISRLLQQSALTGNLEDLMSIDLITLRDLIAKIDEYIASGAFIADDELAALELVLSRLKARYRQL
jgi:hypothetical protein